MAGFGKGSDYFGLPASLSNTYLKLIESSTVPMGVSTEVARDEDGNTAGQGDYESGPAAAIECVSVCLESPLVPAHAKQHADCLRVFFYGILQCCNTKRHRHRLRYGVHCLSGFGKLPGRLFSNSQNRHKRGL
jgi:hypothetical protein